MMHCFIIRLWNATGDHERNPGSIIGRFRATATSATYVATSYFSVVLTLAFVFAFHLQVRSAIPLMRK